MNQRNVIVPQSAPVRAADREFEANALDGMRGLSGVAGPSAAGRRWRPGTALLRKASLAGALGLILSGCVVNNEPAATQPTGSADATMRQSQDKAMGDPMNYSPSFDNVDISGGGINELKTKSMQRDVNDVLNP